jgi:hypothetical protein
MQQGRMVALGSQTFRQMNGVSKAEISFKFNAPAGTVQVLQALAQLVLEVHVVCIVSHRCTYTQFALKTDKLDLMLLIRVS